MPTERQISKVLIANRGEIAVRIARAAAELGMRTVGVYSRDDEGSLHWRRCDEAVALAGSGAPAYLDIEAIVEAAVASGCDAVHPGYGFLSENAAFAQRCIDRGLVFVGPRPQVLELFGDKAAARRLAQEQGVAVCRGVSSAVTLEQARAFAASLGSGAKVMVKAIAGGGGRGMRVVEDPATLDEAFASASSEAKAAFGNGDLYIEELVAPARHIEVQVLGDLSGQVTHLYERECSLQRRQQKLVEFAPAPGISDALRHGLAASALKLARAAGVHTLCTFEFLVDAQDRFVFMEANPRLQVEHTVTEEVMGVDIVQAQFRLAAGARLEDMRLAQADIDKPRGIAVQLRINMERVDALGQALPGAGTLTAFDPPGGAGVRLDTFARAGYTPSTSFDSLLAKLVIHAPSGRMDDLLRRAYRALCEFRIEGVDTNIGFLQNIVRDEDVAAGRVHTRFIEANGVRLAEGMALHKRLHGAVSGGPVAVESRAVARTGPAGSVAIEATLGGRLVRLAVKPGDAVQVQQPIAVIESMKMEHTILASQSGVVLQLAAQVGEAVVPGAALFFIEPREHGDHDGSGFDIGHDDGAEKLLRDIEARKAALLDEQRPAAVAKQRARGASTARERIARFSDPGSFVEIGGLIHSETGEDAPADGVVVGSARVEGRAVMLMAQDFTVFGGSNGHLGRSKMFRAMARCRLNGLPFVMLLDGGGHRIQDGQNSRHYASSTPAYQEFARLSGWVPIVAGVLGAGFAANTNNCGMADLIVMVRGQSEMGLAGPALVKAGTGEQITAQALGGAEAQVDRNGLADLGVASEEEAFAAIRRFLSFLPSNSALPPPREPAFDGLPGEPLREVVPANSRQSYDMRIVVETLADKDSCFEIKPTFGANIVTTLARIGGRPVGFIANQPLVMSGMLDANASEKAAHFIALCDAYGIALVYLVDIPGMSIGSQAESTMLGRRSAKLLFELGHATVPRISVILRKGYGLGYVAMCGGRGFDADACLAWPTAEICAMSVEGSVDVAYRKKFVDAPDPAARRQEIIDGIRAQVSALQAAEGFGVDDVIDPATTRKHLIDLLAQAPVRRPSTMPPKVRSINPV